eukprot:TCONS_00061343-protein
MANTIFSVLAFILCCMTVTYGESHWQKMAKKFAEVLNDGSGCKDRYEVGRCQSYMHNGWCEKYPKVRAACKATCVCNRVLVEEKAQGIETEIVDCQDNARYEVLCERFGGDCSTSGSLGKSLRRHCPRTCDLCCKYL